MRRGPKQKTSGAENEWILKNLRNAFGLWNRSGRGKFSKRQMARRRRRDREPTDD